MLNNNSKKSNPNSNKRGPRRRRQRKPSQGERVSKAPAVSKEKKVYLPRTQTKIIRRAYDKAVRMVRKEFLGNVSTSGLAKDGTPLFKVINGEGVTVLEKTGDGRLKCVTRFPSHEPVSQGGKTTYLNEPESPNGLLTSLASLAGSVGLTATFPWISNVAKYFDSFVAHYMSFDYVPSTGTETKGDISIVTGLDEKAPTPKSKEDLLDNSGAVKSPVWAPVKCPVPQSKLRDENGKPKKFKIATSKSSGAEARQEEFGRTDIIVSTPATNADTELGGLWLNYDVELVDPVTGGASLEAIQYIGVSQKDNAVQSLTSKGGSLVTPEWCPSPSMELNGVGITFHSPGYYFVNWVEQYSGVLPSRAAVLSPELTTVYSGHSCVGSSRLSYEFIVYVNDTAPPQYQSLTRFRWWFLPVTSAATSLCKSGITVSVRRVDRYELDSMIWDVAIPTDVNLKLQDTPTIEMPLVQGQVTTNLAIPYSKRL